MRKVIIYYAGDGRRFEDEASCLKWEERLTAFRKSIEVKIGEYDEGELEIGKGATHVKVLPCEAPWLSPLGACLIKIIDIRRNEDGIVEFQLGDEENKPYTKDNGETYWAKADEFYDEWPQ